MNRGHVVRVLRPGLLTTVQDLGRWGYQTFGVPVAGPMDAFSHRVANLLVGNDPHAATLEITLIGPELSFERDTFIAVAGADFEVTCSGRPLTIGMSTWAPAESTLHFGRRRAGARAYLAVAGGFKRQCCSAAGPRIW